MGEFRYVNSLLLLTESGLYTAMILSRKPNSENFRRWITCEVLPSIREKGYYLQENQRDRKLSTKKDAITLSNDSGGFIKKIVDNLSIQIARFSESTEDRLNQIEAVLAECRQNQDLFAGWKGIKMLVEDMTEIYKLTEEERRMYFTTICQENGISLPEKAILEREPVFYDIKSIACMLGIYSTKSKPHIPFVTTLIAHLKLEKYKKPYGNVAKYSEKAVGAIQEWLIEHRYPQKTWLPWKKKDKAFEVKYLRKR